MIQKQVAPKQADNNLIQENLENSPLFMKSIFLKRTYSDICCELAFNRMAHPQQGPIPSLARLMSHNASLSDSEQPPEKQNVLKKKFTLTEKKIKKKLEEYERNPCYIRENDWKVDEKKGGVILFNKDKKSIISKLIGYIAKRVISSGSFMGISFPTFGMKAQTILQTYCKCLGAVPIIMKQPKLTPLDRFKAFNTIILSISLQFNDIQKPFNPVIGQTFQGNLAGFPVYAQQISHHPPITSLFMEGPDFILHATFELNASLGMNSASGMFYGQLTIEFQDGGIVKGRMPNGTISGMMFGDTKFMPEGALYSYDPKNKYVCSYYVKQKDTFVGQIGKLLPSAQQKFFSMVASSSKQKYQKFKHIGQKQFQTIQSKMVAQYTKKVSYDNELYFSFVDPQNWPIKLTQNLEQLQEAHALLKSDSSFRKDTKLRAQMDIEGSQAEKERIEDEERRLRKLRENFTKKH